MARFTPGLSPTVSLALASACWGIATVISKALLASVPPITVLVLQLAPSVCVLWALVLIRGSQSVTRQGLLPLALLGLRQGAAGIMVGLGLSLLLARRPS